MTEAKFCTRGDGFQHCGGPKERGDVKGRWLTSYVLAFCIQMTATEYRLLYMVFCAEEFCQYVNVMPDVTAILEKFL